METSSRRDALKILTATAGVAGLAALPVVWERPLVEAGILPVAAAASPVPSATATATATAAPTSTSTPTLTPSPTSSPTATPDISATMTAIASEF